MDEVTRLTELARETEERLNTTIEHLHIDLKKSEERLRRMEFAILQLAYNQGHRIPTPIGVCVNAACGYPKHPHWDTVNNRMIDWHSPIIHSGE